jgi:multiple antibiotic resistance protein
MPFDAIPPFDVMPFDALVNAFVTLIVIIEPVALVPLFLSLTLGLSPAQRREVALRACLIAFLILTGAALAGDWLLRQLGITLPAFRIAGGLLLFWIAAEMVFGEQAERKSSTASDAKVKDRINDVAAFPLGIPLLAGPGAITATLLLAGQRPGDVGFVATLIGVIAAALAVAALCLLAAERLDRLIGTTVRSVTSRLLGVILAAMAVQFVIDGAEVVIRGGG